MDQHEGIASLARGSLNSDQIEPTQTGDRWTAILVGPPGSGKTTMARCLSARHPVTLIETGNLLEQEIRTETALGQQIRPYKLAGKLVPPDLIKQVIARELESVQTRWIVFDGFPRSAAQIEIMSQLLRDHHLKLGAVMALVVDVQTILERLSARRVCRQCGAVYSLLSKRPLHEGMCDKCGSQLMRRADDRPEIIRHRFQVYQRETAPIIEFFQREFPNAFWEEKGSEASEVLANRLWRKMQLAAVRPTDQASSKHTQETSAG